MCQSLKNKDFMKNVWKINKSSLLHAFITNVYLWPQGGIFIAFWYCTWEIMKRQIGLAVVSNADHHSIKDVFLLFAIFVFCFNIPLAWVREVWSLLYLYNFGLGKGRCITLKWLFLFDKQKSCTFLSYQGYLIIPKRDYVSEFTCFSWQGKIPYTRCAPRRCAY